MRRAALLLIVLALLVIPAAAQTPDSTLPNGIASGDTTQTSTVLWTRTTAPGTVVFEIGTDPTFAAVDQTLTAEAEDEWVPVKVEVENLTPATEYAYRVTDSAGSTLSGRFVTAAAEGSSGLRFGVTGDWRGELAPFVAVRNAAEQNLDFFVLLGDTIYADYPSPEVPAEQATTLDEFRRKHAEVYGWRHEANYWADVRASTSVFATIDDHEVTNDFAGGAPISSDERFTGDADAYINQSELFQIGMQAFFEYNPLRDTVFADTGDPRFDGRPDLYRYQTYGGDAAIIMLDARSFRDPSVEGLTPIQALNGDRVATWTEALWEPGRTMLGRPQVEALKRDLLAAHEAGITWKFIMVPEPVQHQGWLGGNDRWEGYAPERTEVLQFIESNGIQNVVFIAADVHTTYVNNLTYATEPNGPQTPIAAWEITTGSAAFDAPTGVQLVEGAAQFGLFPREDFEAYQAASLPEQDAILQALFNERILIGQGFDPLGLEDSGIPFELIEGTWVAGHSYGWTMFEIAPETQSLLVTTYGIPYYTVEQITEDPESVLALEPSIISQFRVDPILP